MIRMARIRAFRTRRTTSSDLMPAYLARIPDEIRSASFLVNRPVINAVSPIGALTVGAAMTA
jgi:hypothetical protein